MIQTYGRKTGRTLGPQADPGPGATRAQRARTPGAEACRLASINLPLTVRVRFDLSCNRHPPVHYVASRLRTSLESRGAYTFKWKRAKSALCHLRSFFSFVLLRRAPVSLYSTLPLAKRTVASINYHGGS